MIAYKRVLLKVSGEALSDGAGGINGESVKKLAQQLKEVADCGVQLGVVVGGGNFWRGRTSTDMDRATADYIGMLATVMNGLALSDSLTTLCAANKVMSSFAIDKVCETYTVREARRYMQEKKIVIFAAGTGSPFFSTDTALSLRACEMNADAIIFVKNVDGVYSGDPKTDAKAVKYDEISFDRIISENLKVMDMTAAAMCREYGLTAIAIGKDEKNGVIRVLKGEKLGTTMK